VRSSFKQMIRTYLKAVVPINSYLRPLFESNHLHLQMFQQSGCGNIGFRAVAANIGRQKAQYGDRHLYDLNRETIQSHTLDLEANITFELAQSFVVQKAGHIFTECEDIWGYAQKDQGMAIALADGATESSFAQEWAGLLVNNFVQDLPLEHELIAWLKGLQTQWLSWLAAQELSWFAKRKAAAGAFATFISLWLSEQSWRVMAVGDSCLFVVRDRQLIISFPQKSSQDFNHTPALIGTHLRPEHLQILTMQGHLQMGDRFYLTTDAIACWILRQIEANQNPWVKLEQIDSQALWVDWVNQLRDRHEIANDDTTLLCLVAKASCQS
jgi:hypothetical protein